MPTLDDLTGPEPRPGGVPIGIFPQSQGVTLSDFAKYAEAMNAMRSLSANRSNPPDAMAAAIGLIGGPRAPRVGRPYQSAPDNLMGIRRHGPQRGFDEGNYRHTQWVEVDMGNSGKFVDAVKGLNAPHAMEVARRNWRGENIRPLSEAEARSLDPSMFASGGQ